MKKWLKKNLKRIIEPIIQNALMRNRTIEVIIPIYLDEKKIDTSHITLMESIHAGVHACRYTHVARAKDGLIKRYDLDIRLMEICEKDL